MSLKSRLTLLYTTVLGATLLLLALLLYIFMANNLMAGVDKEISQQSRQILRSIRIVDRFPLPLEQVVLPDVDVFASPDTYLQVLNTSGKIIAKSQNLAGQALPFSAETISTGQGGNKFYETFQYQSSRLRVINLPLIIKGDYLGIIQVGRSLIAVDQALNKLQLLLLSGSFLAMVIAATSGWYLSKVALRPVTEISRIARKIATTADMTRRINYGGPKDELGHLADTFDDMVSKLEKTYHKLQESHSAQKRFVADASHELRTPLTTIRGNVEFLQRIGNSDPAMVDDVLRDIESEAERMSRLIKDMLALARADAGFQLPKNPQSLHTILLKVIRAVEKWAVSHTLEIAGLDNAQFITVNANSDYLQVAFFTLLDNAFKYTSPEGKVTLEVLEKPQEIGIAVTDTGVGISPEDLEKIFTRFYRADPSRKRGGTGLGLAICKWIVEQHEGRIEVDSRVGKGSNFTIWLPLEGKPGS